MTKIRDKQVESFINTLGSKGMELKALGIDEIRAKLHHTMFDLLTDNAVKRIGGRAELDIYTDHMVWHFTRD